MRSVGRKFKNIQKKNPYWSSYVCFAETIKNQLFGDQTICRWFNKLIDKHDYLKSEKEMIMLHLLSPSKSTEDNQK